MDIWVERNSENYQKIKLAFLNFGMPVFDMTEENFLSHKNWDVFTFGIPPSAIDLMLAVKGLDFYASYKNAILFEEDGLFIRTIHKDDLIKAKKSAGRSKDLNDLENYNHPFWWRYFVKTIKSDTKTSLLKALRNKISCNPKLQKTK